MMKSKHRAHDVERFDRWGPTYERSCFTLPTWLVWLLPRSRFHCAAQMRALFEQAGLDVQAQPASVSRFVRITIGTKPVDD